MAFPRHAGTLAHGLECSRVIMAHCNFYLPLSSNSPVSASQVARTTAGACPHAQLTFYRQGFNRVSQAGLKLLTSGDPHTSASQSAGITSMSQKNLARVAKFLRNLTSGYLLLHVADADNLAHEADAGPDEVHAAEILKQQRKGKRRSSSIGSLQIIRLSRVLKNQGPHHCDCTSFLDESQHTRSPYVTQAGLERLGSRDPPTMASIDIVVAHRSKMIKETNLATRAKFFWLMLVIPALWEAEVCGSPEVRSLRPAWLTRLKPCLYYKKYKIETEFHHVAQTALELLGSSDPPNSASQSVRIKGAGTGLMPVIPAFWETEAGGSHEVRSSRPAWPTWRNPVSTKNTKIGWVWWRAPVIPAAREAEAGESPTREAEVASCPGGNEEEAGYLFEMNSRESGSLLPDKSGLVWVIEGHKQLCILPDVADKVLEVHVEAVVWVQWIMPVIPALREAEASGPLEIFITFFSLKCSFTLLPKLECSNTISAHSNFHLPSSSDSLASASQFYGANRAAFTSTFAEEQHPAGFRCSSDLPKTTELVRTGPHRTPSFLTAAPVSAS
ncbi:hypothetical protein AAY473_016206 [Plecturocebus cupreus]